MKTLEQILLDKLAKNGNQITMEQADKIADEIVALATEAVKMAYWQKHPPVSHQIVTILDTETGEAFNTEMDQNNTTRGNWVKIHSVNIWDNDDYEIDEDEEIDALEVWTNCYEYDFRTEIANRLAN